MPRCGTGAPVCTETRGGAGWPAAAQVGDDASVPAVYPLSSGLSGQPVGDQVCAAQRAGAALRRSDSGEQAPPQRGSGETDELLGWLMQRESHCDPEGLSAMLDLDEIAMLFHKMFECWNSYWDLIRETGEILSWRRGRGGICLVIWKLKSLKRTHRRLYRMLCALKNWSWIIKISYGA